MNRIPSPDLSNKVLARLAQKVLSGFPDVLPRAIWCGNPVRSDIAALPEPQQRYAARSGRLNVLVVGGSLGAKAINEALPQALALLPQDERPSVLHQTGKQHFEAVKRAYQQAGVQADIKPFMDEMARHYGECRSGDLPRRRVDGRGTGRCRRGQHTDPVPVCGGRPSDPQCASF